MPESSRTARWAYGPWPSWRTDISWNVNPRNYWAAALQCAALACVLALPPVARLIGVPGHRAAALVLVFAVQMSVGAMWTIEKARHDRRWFVALYWMDLLIGISVSVGLVVASGDPRSPLWTFSVMYASLNGSDYDLGPSIAVLLAHALSPLAAVPLFMLGGSTASEALAAGVVFGALNGIAYHYCALRSVVVRASVAERDALRDEIAAMREREQRTRIARDLHDAVGANLSLTAVYADLIARDPEARGAQDLARALAATARTGLVDLRRTVRALDSTEAGTTPLVPELRARATSVVAGIDVEIASLGGEAVTSARVHEALVAIYQEALQNCVRHAGASRFTVTVDDTVPGRLQLQLADDGRGFDIDTSSPGHGLRNIRARVAELGGEARIESSSEGTRITVDVPTTPGA